MKRFAALAIALSMTLAPVLAKDRLVKLMMDGRQVDRVGGVAMLHDGLIYADSVDLVKTFNGFVSFGGVDATRIDIGRHVAYFSVGKAVVRLDKQRIVMPGKPFMRAGDLYVPLEFFITRIAGARVRVNPARTQANILVNINPVT